MIELYVSGVKVIKVALFLKERQDPKCSLTWAIKVRLTARPATTPWNTRMTHFKFKRCDELALTEIYTMSMRALIG
jgi:hypothetical protein